ncbi:MAG TPA: lamin tail domain-containing protein [Kofleriaceae bacterium]|nr:lamin tail domain-containing protein [Kofleriaceae bacterium]
MRTHGRALARIHPTRRDARRTAPVASALVVLAALGALGAPGALGGCVVDPGDDVGDGDTGTLVGTSAAPLSGGRIVLDEIESHGGSPGDWVELTNVGTAAADLGGWRLRDGDDGHAPYVVPAGTRLEVGARLVLDEARWSGAFALGASDAARLYDGTGALVDAYAWPAHASTTFGRCPDGSGPFATTLASTKGAANACTPPPSGAWPWPGKDAVTTVDAANALGTNVSDLVYQAGVDGAPDVLWAVRNAPSMLDRLVWNGSIWTPDAASGWGAGKPLRFPDGVGQPDAEGLTRTDARSTSIYVAAERKNDVPNVSRLSVLRYDTAAAGATLVAGTEWNLTADLPAVDPNLGLEALTFVPDGALVAAGFLDERAGHAYQPSQYPDHAGGLFFVGLEANGMIYAYALDHASGAAYRVATIASGQPAVMSLRFDAETGYLWAACDNTCGNRVHVLAVDRSGSGTTGRFVVRRKLARPSTLVDSNHEGIAVAPEARCTGGAKPFYWVDDSASGAHALRADSVPCGAFAP